MIVYHDVWFRVHIGVSYPLCVGTGIYTIIHFVAMDIWSWICNKGRMEGLDCAGPGKHSISEYAMY